MATVKWLTGRFPLIGLAPMDGITDEPFRLTQVHVAQPDLMFTEFVSAEGLARGAVKFFDCLLYSPQERPIVAQLFGKDPDCFYQAALILCFLGFDGIDINLGCPAKTVVKHGGGAALITQPQLTGEIIKASRSAVTDFASQSVSLPDLKLNQKTLNIINRNRLYSHCQLPIVNYRLPTLSVKTRLGIDKSLINTWIPRLLSYHLDFITIHGRTVHQGYAGLADWKEISKAVDISKDSSTLILGNGDIKSLEQGIAACQKYGTAGVLIGRAALGNPWVFSHHHPGLQDRFATMLYHFSAFQNLFPSRSTDSVRRHLLAYVSGLPHAKQLRSQLVKVNKLSDLLNLENAIISPC